MINFKRHIEISKHLEKEGTLLGYLGRLEPADRISMMRDITEVYPLNKPINTHFKALDDFSCYTKVEDLVLGQFIMIEQIITGKTNYASEADNDFALARLLMRPKHHETFDNENLEEERDNDAKILNTDVREVYSILQKFLDNREFVLFKQFNGVFYEVPDEVEEEEEANTEKTGEALFQQQWYWYSMVRMLAKEDITRYNDIYMLKMSTVMPEMSYLAQRNKIESAKQRQTEALRKL